MSVILTDIILHQPRQRRQALPPTLLTPHKQRAIPIHVPLRPPQLDAHDDQSDEPEHEEDEGAEDHDAGEQGARVDQVEDEEDEGDPERARGDVVCEVPAESVSSCFDMCARCPPGPGDDGRVRCD